MNNVLKLFLFLISILSILNAEKLTTLEKEYLENNTNTITLTKKEKDFIKSNPIIKVHNELKWPPFNYFENGEPLGYSIDFMNLIAKKAGLKVEYITGPTWDDFLKMMQDGSLDVMLNIVKTPQRQKYLLYTPPYVDNPNAIISKKEKIYNSIESLYGKTVALPKGFFQEEILRTNYPQIKLLPVKNLLESMKAVTFGKADAALGELVVINYLLSEHMMTDLTVSGEAMMGDPEFSLLNIATRKDLPILQSILSKGVESVTIEEKRILQKKWLGKSKPKYVQLTAKEKEFIKNNPIIKVHNESNWPPYNYVKNGKPKGYSIDFMNLIAKKTGLNVEYITGPTWNEFLEMMKNGSLDVMLNIVKTPQRQKYLLYTPSYGDNPNAIISKKNTPYKTIESLFGKTIALPKGFFYEEVLKSKYPEINLLPLKNTLEAMKAVTFGKADAAVGELAVFNHLSKEHMIDNLFVSGEAKIGDPEYSLLNMATRKDLPILQSILTKGIKSLTLSEKKQLQQKWLGDISINTSNEIKLSEDEIKYLSSKSNITMCVDPNWMPFERIDKDGNYKGIGSTIVEIISKKINKPIDLVATTSWSETLNSFKNKKCDIIPIVTQTNNRTKIMNFTKPYIKNSLVVATRSEQFFIRDSFDLNNKKIGIVKGYAYTDLLKEKNPDVKIISVENTKDGLKKVESGELFGFIDALPPIAYVIQKNGMIDLKIAGRLEFDVEFSIASQKNQPLLNSIMQKALNDIEKEQIDSIVGKWISIKVEESINYKTLIYTVVVFLIIIALILYRHISVKKLNKELEKISITDALTDIYNRRYFNEICPKLINSAKRKNTLITFLIIDIDYFKEYNDTYGHQSGDETLVKVAKAIKESLNRADDYCFRIGGEEFGVIFKADTKEEAFAFSNKIKENIENQKIEHSSSKISPYLTVSMGLICKNANDIDNFYEVYKQGDDLLYKAKELGRNRICT